VPRVIVDGARLFYRTYGAKRGTPIVLIHGATADGMTDWGALAPVLGLRHRVIVPDCRGHGRSSNPSGGYSFARMASDIAGLVRGLGIERAHVVGHSNGGNVALVLAREHPDVVASTIVQAGNAYVSVDLFEREPPLFDPDRVAREDPAWRDRMIRTHGRWHGKEYWRTLLTMTLAELLSAPSYTPADLASIVSPALVIEGQKDPVNAPAGHGAFIAANIPVAELWRPDGVGHSVHEERPTEWLDRALDFWARRGTPERDRLWRLGSGPYRDRRITVFDIELRSPDEAGARVTVLDAEQANRVRSKPGRWPIDIRVLSGNAPRANVRIGVADVRAEPSSKAEMVSQVVFGEEVDALETRGVWQRVQIVTDGYLGWMRTAALDFFGSGRTPTHRVVSDWTSAWNAPGGQLVTRLPMGARLCVVDGTGDRVESIGPDGTRFWVDPSSLLPLDQLLSVEGALERFQQLLGVPYLFSGRTPWGIDCSGLSQAFLREIGIAVPRDADQQWAVGAPRDGHSQPGDLEFFSLPGSDSDAIDHVAVTVEGSAFLHASGAAGSVVISSLDRTSPVFEPALVSSYLGARTYTVAKGNL
jgi:pimeloyl-ACP methyl ester carboxylesterase